MPPAIPRSKPPDASARTAYRTSLTPARIMGSSSPTTSTRSLPRSDQPSKPAASSQAAAKARAQRRATATSSWSRSRDACARTAFRTFLTRLARRRPQAAATLSGAPAHTSRSAPLRNNNRRRTNTPQPCAAIPPGRRERRCRGVSLGSETVEKGEQFVRWLVAARTSSIPVVRLRTCGVRSCSRSTDTFARRQRRVWPDVGQECDQRLAVPFVGEARECWRSPPRSRPAPGTGSPTRTPASPRDHGQGAKHIK